ncbi:hypothetical protein [Dipodfec virus UOA04_Rod_781]|nr:hypothetical protein [Dipodfec virus UOA04_Rod_781]
MFREKVVDVVTKMCRPLFRAGAGCSPTVLVNNIVGVVYFPYSFHSRYIDFSGDLSEVARKILSISRASIREYFSLPESTSIDLRSYMFVFGSASAKDKILFMYDYWKLAYFA